MANYIATHRTNYFRVTDEEKFQKIIKKLSAEDIACSTRTAEDGTIYHFFGGYSSCQYYPTALDNEAIAKNVTAGAKYYDENHVELSVEELESADEVYDEGDNMVFDKYDNDGDMEGFFKEMQTILPDGEALIYVEIGNEKLRYVGSYSAFVTKDEIIWQSTSQWAKDCAKKLGIEHINLE